MMERRFEELAARYAQLRVAVVGDVCLDRYLEIDPVRKAVSYTHLTLPTIYSV